jgi:hypothetical protein
MALGILAVNGLLSSVYFLKELTWEYVDGHNVNHKIHGVPMGVDGLSIRGELRR